MASGLREMRELHGLGVRELARLANIHPATYSRMERGRHYPRVDEMYRIAQVLGLKGITDVLPAVFPELEAPR